MWWVPISTSLAYLGGQLFPSDGFGDRRVPPRRSAQPILVLQDRHLPHRSSTSVYCGVGPHCWSLRCSRDKRHRAAGCHRAGRHTLPLLLALVHWIVPSVRALSHSSLKLQLQFGVDGSAGFYRIEKSGTLLCLTAE